MPCPETFSDHLEIWRRALAIQQCLNDLHIFDIRSATCQYRELAYVQPEPSRVLKKAKRAEELGPCRACAIYIPPCWPCATSKLDASLVSK